jgi:translation initiation factor 1A
MPKKKKGGKKKGKSSQTTEKRPLTLREEMQEYAKITTTLGDRRMTVVLPDSSEIMALIPGRFRKRCWMSVGDVVLISRRDFQDTKVDIVHKYNSDELSKLFKKGEIPAFFMDTEAKREEDECCGFTIGNNDEGDENGKDKDFDFEAV